MDGFYVQYYSLIVFNHISIIVWMSLSISDFHVRCPISSHVLASISQQKAPTQIEARDWLEPLLLQSAQKE